MGVKRVVVTGAFSYSGSRIAELVLEAGHEVRTLTYHPNRRHRLQGRVQALPYRFDDPRALTSSLEGVTTLYNTYWVRFEHGSTTYAGAVANSRALFQAAREAGVSRIVHVSIANPSLNSPLPYYRGKALVEQALVESGIPHSIVRPTWLFGGGQDILANNIAWFLRRMPIFAIAGNGRYLVQPVHVDEFAHICVESARCGANSIRDAAGPDILTFEDLVRAIGRALGNRGPIVHVPSTAMALLARAVSFAMRDVVLTTDEIRGLTAGLLVSHQPPLGRVSFRNWLDEVAPTLGREYLSELDRHFRTQS